VLSCHRSKLMLANKAAGVPSWFHPGSLCSGGRFANNSVCVTAVQSALGMLSCAWHLCTGGRQAEAFRCRKTDSGVEGVSAESKPPVWVLGLAGADVVRAFQAAQGTGWYMVSWHAKASSSGTVLLGASVCSMCGDPLLAAHGYAINMHEVLVTAG
jgi:hypothetical protein